MADKKDLSHLGDINVQMGDHNQVRDIGHKINVAPARATLTDNLKEQILDQIPKSKPVKLVTVGHAADQAIGSNVTSSCLRTVIP